MIKYSLNDPATVAALMSGQLVVARTDTIYGVLARAEDPAAIARLYAAKRRAPQKSCIVLVASIDDIPGLTQPQKQAYLELNRHRPTTVITSADHLFPNAPHQHDTLAFRLVAGELAELIRQTGPLLAPSANPEGLPPARTISEAMDYFGDAVSVYVDGGTAAGGAPSRIVRFDRDEMYIVRE